MMNSAVLQKTKIKSSELPPEPKKIEPNYKDSPREWFFNGTLYLNDKCSEYFGRFKWDRVTRQIGYGKIAIHFPEERLRGLIKEGEMFPERKLHSLHFSVVCNPQNNSTHKSLTDILFSFKPHELDSMPPNSQRPTWWNGIYDSEDFHGSTNVLVYPSGTCPRILDGNM